MEQMLTRTIATVTLTYNRLAALQRCVASIRRDGADQIIVVDNHSTDGTAAWLAEQTDIHTVRLPSNRGVVARNLGFDIVHKNIDHVVQIDDDVEMCAGWPDVVKKALESREVIACGQQGGYVGNFTGLLPSNVRVGTAVDTLTGFCWAINKRSLPVIYQTKHHGEHLFGWHDVRYDEDFGMRWHEESDLQCALRFFTGWKLVTCSQIAVHNSMAGPVDWDLHNANLERLRGKWIDRLKSEA